MNINVGVVGATGLVGYEIVKCLEELKNEKIKIYCYASSKSNGEIIQTDREMYTVEELKEEYNWDYTKSDSFPWYREVELSKQKPKRRITPRRS